MQACVHCGKSGEFLTFDAVGLCQFCSPEHAPIIAEAMQGIADGAATRSKARKATHQLEHLRDSIDHCNALMAYPGLARHGFDPATLRAELEAVRTETVEQAIRDHWFAARERAKDAATHKGMVGPYAKAIANLQGLVDLLDDTSLIDKAVIVMRAERDALVFEDFYRLAQLAEQTGRKNKARDLYIEAVFWLRKDGTPDAYQEEKIALAEAQIERLGGRPKPKATA